MDQSLPEWLVTLGHTIYWICQVALLIPLWMAWQRRRFWTPPLQALFWILTVLEINCFFLNLLPFLYRQGYAWAYTNWPLIHLQTNLDGLGHILVFYCAIRSPRIRKGVRIVVPLLAVLALVDSFYLNPFAQYKHDIYTQVAQYSVALALCLLYLEQLIQEIQYRRIERNPMFWVAIYTIISLAGTLIMGSLINTLLVDIHAPNLAKFYRAIFGLVESSVVLLSYFLLFMAYRNCGREDHELLPSY